MQWCWKATIPRGRAFALFLRPHTGAFIQLIFILTSRNLPILKEKANARGLARRGGGDGHCWDLLMH